MNPAPASLPDLVASRVPSGLKVSRPVGACAPPAATAGTAAPSMALYTSHSLSTAVRRKYIDSTCSLPCWSYTDIEVEEV